MKFCRRNTYNYIGVNNVDTSIDYVTEKNVLEFHGKEFFNKWLENIKNKPTFKFDNNICYYYIDYAFAARQTDSFLNPLG
jgi:hypothetical protein